jgi:hypothetical protein
MGTDEFLILLYLNIDKYVLSLAISLVLLYPIFKKFTHGVIDPLFYQVFMAALANAIPIFLYITSNIDVQQFLYVVSAEGAFWLGFALLGKSNYKLNPKIFIEDDEVNTKIFFTLLFIYVFVKVTAFMLLGLPILMGSRLEMYADSGGLGVLERLSTLPAFFCVSYSFHILNKIRHLRFWAYFTFFIVTVVSVLSGSKGAILLIAFCFFCYTYLYQEKVILYKKFLKYIPFIIAIPLIIIFIQSSNGVSVFESLIIRFVANGDVYYESLPENNIDLIHINNKFTYYFSNILWPLRIINMADVDTVIGFQLLWSLDDSFFGTLSGPNTRVPILGWVFFRWGGVIFCFFQGLATSFFMYRSTSFLPRSVITSIYIGYVYFSMTMFITDPGLGISAIFDVTMNTFILLLIFLFFNKSKIIEIEK